MNRIFSALLLSAALSLPGLAQADMSMHHGHMSHGDMGRMSSHGHGMGEMDKMGDMMGMCLAHMDQMGLSEEQMAKAKPIKREMRRKEIQYKSELKLAELDLMEILEQRDFDLDKASAVVKKISNLKTNHYLENLKYMKELRGMMTDDQFEGTPDQDEENED